MTGAVRVVGKGAFGERGASHQGGTEQLSPPRQPQAPAKHQAQEEGMTALKVRREGESLVVTIPQDLADRLGITEASRLFLDEASADRRPGPASPDATPDARRQTAAARTIMGRRRNALRKLAR